MKFEGNEIRVGAYIIRIYKSKSTAKVFIEKGINVTMLSDEDALSFLGEEEKIRRHAAGDDYQRRLMALCDTFYNY